MPDSSDRFAGVRPSFIANTLVVVALMVLYFLSGVLLLLAAGGSDLPSLLAGEPAGRMLTMILASQAGAQLLLLAMPVFLLVTMHTRNRNPFSAENLAFLGIGNVPDARALLLAVAGIFLLQPILFTISTCQELYLWPALGKAGAEVVRQQAKMDAFIRALVTGHGISGFLAVAVVLALVPAFCEELLFRGYVQKNYTKSLSAHSAVMLTGLIFAFFHLNPANLLPLAFLGWFIGYIYVRSDNLAVSAFVHFVNNLGALSVLYFTGSDTVVREANPERTILSAWWWVLVAVSMVLFIMSVRRFSAICPGNDSPGKDRIETNAG
jgi:uncharacterized protein